MDFGAQTTEKEDAWFAFCFADHDGDSADPDCLLEKAESAVQHAESAARGGPSNVTAGQTGTPILSAHAAVEPGAMGAEGQLTAGYTSEEINAFAAHWFVHKDHACSDKQKTPHTNSIAMQQGARAAMGDPSQPAASQRGTPSSARFTDTTDQHCTLTDADFIAEIAGWQSHHPAGYDSLAVADVKLVGPDPMRLDGDEEHEPDPRVLPLTQSDYLHQNNSNARLAHQATRRSHCTAGLCSKEQRKVKWVPLTECRHDASCSSQAALAEGSPSSAKSSGTPFRHRSNQPWPDQDMPQRHQFSDLQWNHSQGVAGLDGAHGSVNALNAAAFAAPLTNSLGVWPTRSGTSGQAASRGWNAAIGFALPLQSAGPLQPHHFLQPSTHEQSKVNDCIFNQVLAGMPGTELLPGSSSLLHSARRCARKRKAEVAHDVQPTKQQKTKHTSSSRATHTAAAPCATQGPVDDLCSPHGRFMQQGRHVATSRAGGKHFHAATKSRKLYKGLSWGPAPAPAGAHGLDLNMTPNWGASAVQAPQPMQLLYDHPTQVAAQVQPPGGPLVYPHPTADQPTNASNHSMASTPVAPAPAPSPPAAAMAQMVGYRVGQVVWAKSRRCPWWPATVQQPTVEQARRTKMQAGQLFVVYFGDEQEVAALSRESVAKWEAKPGSKQCRDPRRPKAIKEAEAAISRGAAV